MGISITYFFGLRMGVGMGMVFVYNQLLISAGDVVFKMKVRRKTELILTASLDLAQFRYFKSLRR
jgi:ribosomal protein L16/L10AE